MNRCLLLPPTFAVLAGCAAVGGCSVDPCALSDPEAAWIEPGEAIAGYEPIEDGRVLEVERGSQGGMHVIVSARFGHVAPGSEIFADGLLNEDLPWVSFDLLDEAGELTLENEAPRLALRSDGYYELEPRLAQFRHFAELPDDWASLDYAEVEAEMESRQFELQVNLEDTCGLRLQGSRAVGLRFPPRD